MKEKQLMIGIPTKDHPKYIQIYLARILDDARSYGIDVHIYDSSGDDQTKNIVIRRIENGYDNLFYHKCDIDDITLPPTQKMKYILVDSGYKYAWLCGDGVMLNLDNVMPYVQEEMKKNRDLIIFGGNENKDRYIEYNDPLKLIVEQWKAISLSGGAIYKGDLFSEEEWNTLLPIYTDNIQLAGIFDIFSRKKMNVVSVDTAFCTESPYKSESTWITGGHLLQVVVDHIPTAVDRLPQMYEPVKERVRRSFSESRGMLLPPNIWWLRATENITPAKTRQYKKQLKRITDTKYVLFMGASLIPKKAAEKLANIFSYS